MNKVGIIKLMFLRRTASSSSSRFLNASLRTLDALEKKDAVMMNSRKNRGGGVGGISHFVTRGPFLESPENFSGPKNLFETASRLFWKADPLICFQGNKKINDCEV